MTGLETGRLLLREFTADDADFVLRLVNEPAFLRYIGDRGVRKDDGVEVGMCGVLKRDTLPDPDIGFSFFPEYWSQGYALESARAVMHHARATLGLGRILAITTMDNEPSMRLLGKLGFHFDRMVSLGSEELRLFVSEP